MRLKRIVYLGMVLVSLLGLWGCGGKKDPLDRNQDFVANSSEEPHGSSSDRTPTKPEEGASEEPDDRTQEEPKEEASGEPAGEGSKEMSGEPEAVYETPDFADSAFHEEQAKGSDNAKIDLSCVAQGYVALSATSAKRLKFLVEKDGITYQYDIDSGGTPSIFPLQGGDGTYNFRVMENTTGTKYGELYATSCSVKLEDEFQPFLRPSDYVKYTKDSACVKKAGELAQEASDALGVVGGVFEFICDTVTYDQEKARTVQSGYLPDPDETMSTGKGICFDYAALTAAMLRSQGIPTKMVFGNVSPDDLYHAWNMFYTEETGWVTAKYEVKGGDWNRLDLTFSSNGTDLNFIGDGSNYSDVYYY